MMCAPVHSFLCTFLITTPVFLLTVYVQNSYESNLFERIHVHLPPELQAEIPAGFNVLKSVRNISFIAIVFLFSHYLQNLQTSTLLIEKYEIRKQHEQLNHFFQSQKNAIIVYKVTTESETKNTPEKSLLVVPFQNQSVSTMLNLSLAAETAIDAQTDENSSSHIKRFTKIENVNQFQTLNFEGASMSIIEVLARSDAG